MTRNVSNTVLSPASVTFSAYAKTGEAAQEAYTGYLYAECSYDGGGTWSAVSGAAASSPVSYTHLRSAPPKRCPSMEYGWRM